MNLRTALIIIGAILLLGLTASVGCGNSTNITSIQSNASGAGGGIPSLGDNNGTLMQDDDEPSDGDGSEGEEDPDEGEDSEDGEEPAEEEPSEDEAAPSMGDILGQPADTPLGDENLQDALAGLADYEVTYDTTRSRAENTPQALRAEGVTYAGEESAVAQRTKLINELDILRTLADWYENVEEDWAADPERDFDPDDPESTMNYFEPRGNPFVIPDLIPEELRPELEGTGLEGAVDPELLAELFWAEYAANLRLIPIIIVGTLQAGNNRGCIYSIGGSGWSRWIEEGGQPHCVRGWGGPPFSITCTQVSEDFVVLTLRGTSDWGCRYAATGPVVRTFHVTR